MFNPINAFLHGTLMHVGLDTTRPCVLLRERTGPADHLCRSCAVEIRRRTIPKIPSQSKQEIQFIKSEIAEHSAVF